MEIRTRRTVLVPMSPHDPDPAWDATDPYVACYLEEIRHSPWRREWDRRRRQGFLVMGPDGTTLGEAELVDIRRGEAVAEIRICLYAPGARDHGYGTEVVRALLSYAARHLVLRTVYLRVYADNERAVACYAKCGFKTTHRLTHRRFGAGPVLLMEADLAKLGPASERRRRAPVSRPS